MTTTQLIITAAGLSRRHPPNKLLLPSGNRTVIETTVWSFIDSNMGITVVTGHQWEKIKPLLNRRFGDRITIVYNPDFATGLTSSIKAGLTNTSGEPDYWAFCNGDKPFIQPATIEFLLAELERIKPLILVPTFSERMGHPTFFSSELTPELLALSGDNGAREIILRHGNAVRYVPVNDAGVALDMDSYLDSNNTGHNTNQ
ncbi:MAG: nucleotidyltransferase family protein [Candidatus Neomarinimicrobiota bacterium]